MTPNELYTTYLTALNIISKASMLMHEGFYQKDKGVKEKTAHDLVTVYDKKIEDFIKQELKMNFPNHSFLGEESSNDIRTVPTGLTWILDPIDGTSNFVHSAPETAISLALTQDQETLIGIISCPILQKLYSACRGKGSFLNGSPICTSSAKSVSETIIAVEISVGCKSSELLEKLGKRASIAVKNCHGVRSIGSAAISLAYVAQGLWDVYHCEGLYPWDYAAGVLLITEAGGCVLDSLGGKFDLESSKILAANNKIIAEEVVKMFKEVE